MNLCAPKLEQAIRTAARRELRASPETWREFKRRRQRIKPLIWKAFGLVGLMMPGWLALFCLARRDLEARAGWAALFLLLLAASAVAVLAPFLKARMQHLARLPIADGDLFRVGWSDLRYLVCATLPGLWCLLLWLPPHSELVESWAATRAALLPVTLAASLLVVVLLATVCVATAWFRAAAWVNRLLKVAWPTVLFVVLVAGEDGHPVIRAAVDQFGGWVRLLTPPGWVLTWFVERVEGDATAWHWLGPVVLICLIAIPAWRRMRDSFAYSEADPTLPQMTPQQAMALAAVKSRGELAEPVLSGPTAIEDSLRARDFLRERPGLGAGWLDRLILRQLTPRERGLLDFLALTRPNWTRNWWRGLGFCTGGLLLAELIRGRGAEFVNASILGYFVAGYALLLCQLPMINGLTRAFIQCPVAGGSPMPLCGCLPVGYAEVVRLDWKISLVRALTALPVVLGLGGFIVWHSGGAPWLGGLAGFKAVLLCLALRPALMACHFSSGTNDSRLTRLRGWGMLALVLFTTFTVMLLGIFSVAMTNWWTLMTLPVVALLSWGFYRYHRRSYDGMRFDLQPSALIVQHPVG